MLFLLTMLGVLYWIVNKQSKKKTYLISLLLFVVSLLAITAFIFYLTPIN